MVDKKERLPPFCRFHQIVTCIAPACHKRVRYLQSDYDQKYSEGNERGFPALSQTKKRAKSSPFSDGSSDSAGGATTCRNRYACANKPVDPGSGTSLGIETRDSGLTRTERRRRARRESRNGYDRPLWKLSETIEVRLRVGVTQLGSSVRSKLHSFDAVQRLLERPSVGIHANEGRAAIYRV